VIVIKSISKRMVVTKNTPIFRVLFISLTGLFLASLAFGSGYVVASFKPDQTHGAVPKNLVQDGDALAIFQEAWELVTRDFFGPLPSNRERTYGAVRGLLDTLDDPYTVLVEPIPRQLEQDDLRGSYGGVGISLSYNADGQIVLSPFRNSPAAQAGIVEGDILLTIDGFSVAPGMDITQDVAARIRGEVGTDVTLTIQRGEETLVFTVTRQVIETPSVNWRMLEQYPDIAYVQIKTFTDRTPDELQDGLEELDLDAAQGLVIDLRNNGGGLLQSSIDVVDQFLDSGTILYERRSGEDEKTYLASDSGAALEIPIVVLVNQGTASASEIVAGAIQDQERGVLIGEPTFGKGSVQLIFDLSDGSSLHVTAARWYTPGRHELDGVGLTPDILIEVDPQSEVDLALERAIDYLRSGE
jgi:carboxyl-terminal processing protease